MSLYRDIKPANFSLVPNTNTGEQCSTRMAAHSHGIADCRHQTCRAALSACEHTFLHVFVCVCVCPHADGSGGEWRLLDFGLARRYLDDNGM